MERTWRLVSSVGARWWQWPCSCCTRDASVRAPLKRCLRLTSGPWQFFYLIRFSDTHILIFEKVILLMPKFHHKPYTII
jgi:hypothetical protein